MINVAAAVIIKDGRVLLASRPADKPPVAWEFPGGKLEAGETPFDAVKRELMEELSLDITPQQELYLLKKENITISFILSAINGCGEPIPRENQEFKWVPISEDIPKNLLKNDADFWIFLKKIK